MRESHSGPIQDQGFFASATQQTLLPLYCSLGHLDIGEELTAQGPGMFPGAVNEEIIILSS